MEGVEGLFLVRMRLGSLPGGDNIAPMRVLYKEDVFFFDYPARSSMVNLAVDIEVSVYAVCCDFNKFCVWTLE